MHRRRRPRGDAPPARRSRGAARSEAPRSPREAAERRATGATRASAGDQGGDAAGRKRRRRGRRGGRRRRRGEPGQESLRRHSRPRPATRRCRHANRGRSVESSMPAGGSRRAKPIRSRRWRSRRSDVECAAPERRRGRSCERRPGAESAAARRSAPRLRRRARRSRSRARAPADVPPRPKRGSPPANPKRGWWRRVIDSLRAPADAQGAPAA